MPMRTEAPEHIKKLYKSGPSYTILIYADGRFYDAMVDHDPRVVWRRACQMAENLIACGFPGVLSFSGYASII